MRTKRRLISITILLGLSVMGGMLGQQFDADIGFVIGILGTYFTLSLVLVATGKVKFNR